jgi:hypothetical protein
MLSQTNWFLVRTTPAVATTTTTTTTTTTSRRACFATVYYGFVRFNVRFVLLSSLRKLGVLCFLPLFPRFVSRRFRQNTNILASGTLIAVRVDEMAYFGGCVVQKNLLFSFLIHQCVTYEAQAILCRLARHMFVSGYCAYGEFCARLIADEEWHRRALLAMAQHALSLGDEPRAKLLLLSALDLPCRHLARADTIYAPQPRQTLEKFFCDHIDSKKTLVRSTFAID